MMLRQSDLEKIANIAINESRYGGSLDEMVKSSADQIRVYLEHHTHVPLQKLQRAYVELDEQEVWSEKAKLVREYLPGNFTAKLGEHPDDEMMSAVIIEGYDNAGWTMDGYVIPRLASVLIPVRKFQHVA